MTILILDTNENALAFLCMYFSSLRYSFCTFRLVSRLVSSSVHGWAITSQDWIAPISVTAMTNRLSIFCVFILIIYLCLSVQLIFLHYESTFCLSHAQIYMKWFLWHDQKWPNALFCITLNQTEHASVGILDALKHANMTLRGMLFYYSPTFSFSTLISSPITFSAPM